MKIKFNLNKTCTHDTVNACAELILNKIETITGKLNNNGHISIYHEKENHVVWIFLYDENGIHESESKGKTIFQNSKKVKKFTGQKPTIEQLKEII